MFSHRSLHEWYDKGKLDKTKKIFQALGENGEETEGASFDDLDRTATEIAQFLLRKIAGSKRSENDPIAQYIPKNESERRTVLLMYPPEKPLHFASALLGCVYSGCIAVPVSPPHPGANFNYMMKNICNIVQDCKAVMCLSMSNVINMIKLKTMTTSEKFDLPKNFTWIAMDNQDLPNYISVNRQPRKPEEITNGFELFSPTEDSLMMLQYSSGSTGSPKGIMLTHKNVYNNCCHLIEYCGSTSSSVGLSWLPLYHDMGIMVHLFTPLLLAPIQYIMSPLSFLKKPILWLELMSKYKGEFSGAPNFAYALLANKYGHLVNDPSFAALDLSSWKVAYCGAEPIRSTTITAFCNTFAKWKFPSKCFCPCYGLAEATLLVTYSPVDRDATMMKISRPDLAKGNVTVISEQVQDNKVTKDEMIVIGLGSGHKSTKLRIVDPDTKQTLPPGKVGELWISNACVSKGYWNKPELSKEIFGAYTSDTKEGPFLRTGDLAFIMPTGEMFFTSRLKDLIILNGVNYWPHDIETSVENCHPALRKGCSAAFSKAIEDANSTSGETLCIVAEVKREINVTEKLEEEIKRQIQQKVYENHSFSVELANIALIEAGSIPKTTSGKIRRTECRRRLEENELRYLSKGGAVNKMMHNSFGFIHNFVVMLWALIVNLTASFWKKSVHKPSSDRPVQKSPVNNARKQEKTEHADDIAKELKPFQDFMVQAVAKQLNMESKTIDLDAPLYQYGLKSVDAVMICGEMERFMNKQISPTCFYEFYTINKLAYFLMLGADEALVKAQQGSVTDVSEFQLPGTTPRVDNQQVSDKIAFVLGTGIAVPEHRMEQSSLYDSLLQHSNTLGGETKLLPKVQKIFCGSGIHGRYLVMPPEQLKELDSTEERNIAYNKFAPSLAAQAAKKALERWGGNADDITHVMSLSCTGTCVPGLEFLLIDELGLNRNVIRLGVNFMGCFGGLAALRTAQSLAQANPSYRVLFVCTELCSLHVQKDDVRTDNLVAETIFGDGAAACVVGCGLREGEQPSFEIVRASCHALKDTKDKIRWDLSNTGYKVGLEPDIAFLLGQSIEGFCQALVNNEFEYKDAIWAIHPGGKAILEIIERKLGLTPEQMQSTWKTYQTYGNMSSATVIFILDHINQLMKKGAIPKNKYNDIVSLAFGPGLSVEGVVLKMIQ